MKSKSEMVDEASGVIVAVRGFAESWQTPFAYFDPRSDATSRGDDRFFHVVADVIRVEENSGPGDHSRKRTVGIRFNAGLLNGALRNYHQGDPEKLKFATGCIVEAARLYLQNYAALADPIIEIV